MVPKVKHSGNRYRATPSALLLGIGNAKGNLDVLSAVSKTYSMPAETMVPIKSKSTSSASHGSKARAGRWESC